MALTQKERSANCYKRRKESGLCPRCGRPLDREGHYCSRCLEKVNFYHRENRNFYRKNGLCTECGKNRVFGDEKICHECRAKREMERKPLDKERKEIYEERFRNRQRNLYQERKELGICTRCGKRKAIAGKVKCGICLEKDAEIHRKRYFNRPYIREERIKNHLCLWCGKPAAESKKLCTECLQKCAENGRKYGGKNQYWKNDNKMVFMKN